MVQALELQNQNINYQELDFEEKAICFACRQ